MHIRSGRWIDPKKISRTLGEWYADWVQAQDYLSINTEQTYAQHWRKHIAPRWGNVALGDILPIHVQAWERELSERYARSTVVSIMSPFKRMLEDALVNGLLSRSELPAKRRASKRDRRQAKGVAVSLETWEAICTHLNPLDALLARIIHFTGMRWSEVAAMRTRFLTLTPATGEQPAAAVYYLHPDIGAVHEDASGHRHYGAPKSGPGREWDLPAFLAQAAYLVGVLVQLQIGESEHRPGFGRADAAQHGPDPRSHSSRPNGLVR